MAPILICTGNFTSSTMQTVWNHWIHSNLNKISQSSKIIAVQHLSKWWHFSEHCNHTNHNILNRDDGRGFILGHSSGPGSGQAIWRNQRMP